MKYFLSFVMFSVFLFGCQSNNKINKNSTDSELIMSSNETFDYDSIFDDQAVEDDEKYKAYFFETKDKLFLTNKTSNSRLDYTIRQLIESTLNQAFNTSPEFFEEINIALEVNSPFLYKDEVLFSAEEYIVQSPGLTILAQQDDIKNIIGKILKREIDPFYESGTSQFDNAAKVSDLILYILVTENVDGLFVKSSVLDKSGKILGIKNASISIGKTLDESTVEFVTVKVPPQFRAFELMKTAVSQEQLYGFGSKTVSASNMSLEQANGYCNEHNMHLTSPYVFEYARRAAEFDRPKGIVNLELISALDSEDADEEFYDERDYLELEEDDQSNHFLVFDWNSESYSIVSNSYSSEKMTFRCYKQ